MSNTKNYSKDVTTIVETAFVPGSVEEIVDKVTLEKRPLSAEEKMAAFFTKMSGMTVTSPTAALPSNGEHFVVIDSYEYKEGFRGKGDYFKLSLKELKKNITWDMSVPADPTEFMRFLDEINMYNKGIVYGFEALEALGKLQSQKFRVWTQQYKGDDGKDRAKTYSNPVKYEKFARYLASQQAKSSREDKAPWEE